jgi:3-hydroxyisobutyrate dehydrogenase
MSRSPSSWAFCSQEREYMTNSDTATREPGQNASPTVAVLGLGQMGGRMATRLVSAGLSVRVWDRSPAKVGPLVDAGATGTASPAETALGADILLTMLSDGPAVHSVMGDPEGPLAVTEPGTVWLQMSTVGIDWTDQLAGLAGSHGVTFVDAPVSGSIAPAEAGTLLVLASGPVEAQGTVAPVLDALGRRTVWLGPAGAGSRAKLVLNNWLVDLVESIAETLRFAGALGVDPELIIELLEAPIGSPYANDKGRDMLDGDFTPSFALKHAVKDADLALAAAKSAGVELALTQSLIASWHRAVTNGRGDEDLSVVYADGAVSP